jgi:hypothetical protein
MASSAVAMRSAVASPGVVAGRFVAGFVRLTAAVLEVARGAVFFDFFDISSVPDRAALSGLGTSRKRPK